MILYKNNTVKHPRSNTFSYGSFVNESVRLQWYISCVDEFDGVVCNENWGVDKNC